MKYKTIIDGVNVSECEYLNSLDNGVSECILGKKQMLKYRVCDCNHNCYYKQRQRAEQECETFKSENFTFEELVKTQENLIDNYKQALDEIETLLQDALDTEKTDTQESFDNFYKCLDIIAKAKEQ